MIWIVIAEDPWPDKYIPILVRPRHETLEEHGKPGRLKVFSNEHEAISHATQLKEKYRVKSIRIFYSEGHSKKITL